jgi:hypothetical protein
MRSRGLGLSQSQQVAEPKAEQSRPTDLEQVAAGEAILGAFRVSANAQHELARQLR